MKKRPREKRPFVNERPTGECWVWATSMGLVIGLTMIVFLLGMIFYNGLEVFWPKRVATIELREGSPGAIGGSRWIAGEIVKDQEKARPVGSAGEPDRELQLFVGNKDAYGFSFRYLDATDVLDVSYPESAFVAERVEFGRAIFEPIRLNRADGSQLEASAPGFRKALRAVAREASQRREAISEIERDRIGDINRALEELRLRERALPAPEVRSAAEAARAAELEMRRAALQSDFATLAAEASALRERQQAETLDVRLLDGQERTLRIGNVVDFYQPNALGFFGKAGRFFHGFWNFLSEEPREANTEGGIFPAIFGTFAMTLLMSIAVTPFGVLAAIYLREYARQGAFVRSVRIAVNNLAGVPSIVFGVFGLGFFVYFVGGTIDKLFFELALPSPTFGTGGIIWAALTLALMTVPVVIVATEEALAAVSRGAREGSLACGASKWQTIQRVILPASLPGILTGLILAMARGAGEVAPLMLVGVVKLAPTLPIDDDFPFVHLERKFMHLGFHIFDLGFQSPDSEAAKPMVFATTFLLILLVICLNLGAIVLRNRLRKKYRTATF